MEKNRVIQALRDAIKNGGTNPLSAMTVITVGMEELSRIKTMTGPEKLATLEIALRDIASGADGVSNTADDAIAPATVESIVKILDTGLLGDVVEAVLNASRGNYDFSGVVKSIQKVEFDTWWKFLKPTVLAVLGGCLWRMFH